MFKGIFASEIKSMIVPNHKLYSLPDSNKISTVSLSNCYLNELDYRMHSAFRVSVKPRQSYASMNIKLQEQRLSSSKYTSSCSRGIRPNTVSTKYTENLNDDDYERIGSPSTYSNEASAVDNYNEKFTCTRDAFRPSPIRKLNKPHTADENDKPDNSARLSYNTSKFVHNIEEKKMRSNIKSAIFRSKTIYFEDPTMAALSNREIEPKGVYNDKKSSRIQLKSILKNDERREEVPDEVAISPVKIQLDEDNQLIDRSIITNDISKRSDSAYANATKSYRKTSDIFNEIYSEIQKNENTDLHPSTFNTSFRAKLSQKSSSIIKSANSLATIDTNSPLLQNRSKNMLQTTRIKSNSELDMKHEDIGYNSSSRNSRLHLNNLKEDEFIEFLKVYRLNPADLGNLKNDDANMANKNLINNNIKTNNKNKVNSASLPQSNKSQAHVMNIRTQFLNLYVDKDLYNAKNPLNSIPAASEANINQATQNGKQPTYIYNYLNKLKQSKSASNMNYLLTNEKKENSFVYNHNLNGFNILDTASSKLNSSIANTTTITKSKDKELKNQLNILNFPGIV